MQSRAANRLVQLVTDAAKSGIDTLPARLANADYDPNLSKMISLAVALTVLGRDEYPTELVHEAIREAAGDLGPQVLDAVGVALMFNMINRVSNAFGLGPEWSNWRRTGWIRRITRRAMSWLLPQVMPLASDEDAAAAHSALHALDTVFRESGWGPLPEDCARLASTPHFLEAFTGLLRASLDESALPLAHVQSIDRAVATRLGANRLIAPSSLTSDSTVTAPPRDELEQACGKFADQLTAHPTTISADDVNRLRDHNLDDAEIVDVVFRVAVMNGLCRLDTLLDVTAKCGQTRG